MEYFEYLVHNSDFPLDTQALNEWGKSGWELVAVINDDDTGWWHYYLKRRYYVS